MHYCVSSHYFNSVLDLLDIHIYKVSYLLFYISDVLYAKLRIFCHILDI